MIGYTDIEEMSSKQLDDFEKAHQLSSEEKRRVQARRLVLKKQAPRAPSQPSMKELYPYLQPTSMVRRHKMFLWWTLYIFCFIAYAGGARGLLYVFSDEWKYRYAFVNDSNLSDIIRYGDGVWWTWTYTEKDDLVEYLKNKDSYSSDPGESAWNRIENDENKFYTFCDGESVENTQDRSCKKYYHRESVWHVSYLALFFGIILSIVALLHLILFYRGILWHPKGGYKKLVSVADYVVDESGMTIFVKDRKFGLMKMGSFRVMIPAQYDTMEWEQRGELLRVSKGDSKFLIDIYNNILR